MSSTAASRRASAIARGALAALGFALACGVAFWPASPDVDDGEDSAVTVRHAAAPCELDARVPALSGVSADDSDDGEDHDDGFARPADATLLPPPAMARAGCGATEASPDRRRPRREPALSTGPPSATNAIHS